MLENDQVEAIVALPTEIFFRTGIGTYLWILSNKKPENRKGKVQLIDSSSFWTSIKNEGNKRRIIGDEQRRQIVEIYADIEDSEFSRKLEFEEFGYCRIRVLRPLRMSLQVNDETILKLESQKVWQKFSSEQQSIWLDALNLLKGKTFPFGWSQEFINEVSQSSAVVGRVNKTFVKALNTALGVRDPQSDPVRDLDGNLVSDPELTDYENVPLSELIEDYFAREVLPHVPDAYIDESYLDDREKHVGKIGYEINFNRFFYKYVPPRNLQDIDADLKQVEAEIAELLGEIAQ